ncbi:hypothetical protein CC1G_10676 [Coprinopsis cinerea okayama7|uniref:Uncharacterized protein n=1 Tax=Coprinopsis cinerea (strain Okayama-7 / 130 / ATCC MYA-4618 / FGSC 9003) TaxID=240176 RepID=A8NDQ0_COPC7|nr:hypothetical protein CC1G_10676 [Coprinopsis cinerea okayama7\|eukprot:XP_001832827.2 hypothetical protein CC1G_10676 [Coprinopsis cinerea okayama7\
MARTLRPRKGKQNYAEIPIEEDAPAAGPSKSVVEEDDTDSGSDFSPEKDAEPAPEDDVLDDDAMEEDEEPDEEPEIVPVKTKGKGKAKAKPKPKKTTKAVSAGPTTGRKQTFSLPAPSVHHRHRATPLFSCPGLVERLTSQPPLFGAPQIALTNNFTHTNQVADRANRAWGYNVGPGPLWQLVEDRRWFKESKSGPGSENEAKRRPRVYDHIPVKAGWRALDRRQAAAYLPTANETTDDGSFKPPPPVPCYFGPIKSQVRREVEMIETFPLSEYLPESNAHVFNAGASVWAIDWCPIHVDDRSARSYKQYLAVAPFPNSSHSPEIGVKSKRPSTACIQIWSLSPTKPIPKSPSSSHRDPGQMKCEMILCIDNGPALDLKWCPLPSHDPITSGKRPRKIGLLGGTFEDGSFCIYAVPDPEDMEKDSSGLSLIEIEPILRIELAEASCWSFDWANSGRIAIGTTNGVIAVYDVGQVLQSFQEPGQPTITNARPTHYLNIHQSAIRALAWIQAPPCTVAGEASLDEDPTVIASGGYDGVECLTDIREGRGFIMNRTRDVINTLVFSPFAGGPITMDHENTVKSYAASPSMLGRGHTLLEPSGPVWAVSASEYHPQLAVAAADGTCSTTNTLRSPRRGGSVPFFVHKIYQMDYSRKTKEFRMLDRFLPQEVPDARSAISNAKKASQPAPTTTNGTGAWSQQVGVQRVVWNSGNGLASSCLLASSTASGLCRVDVLWGRWIKDKAPYGGVEQIRMEDGRSMDVDESELSELESDA